MSDLPILIQRLCRPRLIRLTGGADSMSDKKGVDKYFGMDYMGRAEFEFGELPRAVKLMRQTWDKAWVPKRIEHDDCVAWYVGAPEYLEQAETIFRDQVGPNKLHFKEPLRLAVAYDRGRYARDERFDIVGWWALDAPLPWCLFKEKEDALNWIKGIKNE